MNLRLLWDNTYEQAIAKINKLINSWLYSLLFFKLWSLMTSQPLIKLLFYYLFVYSVNSNYSESIIHEAHWWTGPGWSCASRCWTEQWARLASRCGSVRSSAPLDPPNDSQNPCYPATGNAYPEVRTGPWYRPATLSFVLFTEISNTHH